MAAPSPIASPDPTLLAVCAAAIGQRLLAERARPLVVGICGAQGSGKTTLAAALARRFGDGTAVLSVDDLYRTAAERRALAREVHPLFATRGVPGTHDVALGRAILADLDATGATVLPRFDKARDDRVPPDAWEPVSGVRLLLFEGWCVGARPQSPETLSAPCNRLEREEDPDGTWRRSVNDALAGDYQGLFARIDLLILLAAPGFAVVRGWRIEQERALRVAVGPDAAAVMDDAAIERFIAHYERLTRHILTEMPARADLTVELSEDRSVCRWGVRPTCVSLG